MNQVLFAESALTPEGTLGPYWLRTVAERIVETGHGRPPQSPDVHLANVVMAPGFVDVHSHGGGAAAFTDGVDSGRKALAAHRRTGTTTMLASLVSAPLAVLLEQTAALRPLVDSGELAGIHLEGPWLSLEHRGAHDAEMLSDPTPEAVSSLLAHPDADLIKYVTLAPERRGAIGAIERLRAAGVTLGVGHTGASCEQTRDALEAGASAATHLFNAMKGLHHRDPGPALALLEDPSAFLELISDGVHLDAEMIRFIWNSATRNGGVQRPVLVSDAMPGAAAPDGRYKLGPVEVDVIDGVARRMTADGSLGAIAGSTLTLSAAVRESIRHSGIDPAHALRAATSNPADMISAPHVGRLRAGNLADLVVLDPEWNVSRVMYRGRWLDERPSDGPQTDRPAD